MTTFMIANFWNDSSCTKSTSAAIKNWHLIELWRFKPWIPVFWANLNGGRNLPYGNASVSHCLFRSTLKFRSMKAIGWSQNVISHLNQTNISCTFCSIILSLYNYYLIKMKTNHSAVMNSTRWLTVIKSISNPSQNKWVRLGVKVRGQNESALLLFHLRNISNACMRVCVAKAAQSVAECLITGSVFYIKYH